MTACVHRGARVALASPCPSPRPRAALGGGVHTTLRCHTGRSSLWMTGGGGEEGLGRGVLRECIDNVCLLTRPSI